MSELMDILPGVELPVGEVTRRLAMMWEGEAGGPPAEFRASRMNLILHFGLDVARKDARAQFDTLIRFAQRHPGRIIVLCPSREAGDGSMSAKLFSQCHIGETRRERCCCEALMLGYKSESFGHLFNQVSVWLESDLPTYHWFTGVPAERIRAYYDNLLTVVRRTVYDGDVEPEEIRTLDWPDPSRVGDLAWARLLPVRQAIGQFLSGHPIEVLCRGLESVTVEHDRSLSAEGAHLLAWLRDCLAECGRCEHCAALGAAFEKRVTGPEADHSLGVAFTYGDGRYFRWRKFREGLLGEIEAKIDSEVERISTRIKPLTPEQALSEALFF